MSDGNISRARAGESRKSRIARAERTATRGVADEARRASSENESGQRGTNYGAAKKTERTVDGVKTYGPPVGN